MDCAKHPLLDDIVTHSDSSKNELYKTSTFGWFTSMFRIIQIWIIQIHFRMAYRIIQISFTFQFCRGESKHISSKFGQHWPNLEDLCGSRIFHFWNQTLPGWFCYFFYKFVVVFRLEALYPLSVLRSGMSANLTFLVLVACWLCRHRKSSSMHENLMCYLSTLWDTFDSIFPQ